MSIYTQFPIVTISGQQLRDIMVSARPAVNQMAPLAYAYPYTVKDYETPTSLAYDYYGDISFIWLIAIANNIIDFRTQWVKSQSDFEAFIQAKYGGLAEAQAMIVSYYKVDDPTYPLVTPTTYQYMAAELKGKLAPTTAYDYEFKLNESYRYIQLIDKAVASTVQAQFIALINNGP